MSQIKIGQVGYGYWGKNLLRNVMRHHDCEVVGVVDSEESARFRCQTDYPQIHMYDSISKFLEVTKPDAVVIATPPDTHADIAVLCLEAGASVLVEKPLALSTHECNQIIAAAEKHNKICMVDHTFCYSPPVQALEQLISKGTLGDLQYFDSVRVNLGGFQPKTNVLWDLAPHDLSILDLWTGQKTPTAVTAIGKKHFGSPIENMCYVNLLYDNDFIAHLHINWAAPVKVRQIMLGGTEKMAIYDDSLPSEKIRIYDKGVEFKDTSEDTFRINYRSGTMVAPVIEQHEPLFTMVSEFVDCVKTNRAPKTDAYSGRRIVSILETISQSLEMGGQPVEVKSLDKLKSA